jgi:PPOX class probable F420-dependent enzyme
MVESGRVGRLGLIDDAGRPRVLPVTFALVNDQAWTAVDDKPKRSAGAELARVRWLRQRPEATLLVDHYADDWSQLAWIQLIGRVTIVADAEPPAQLVGKYEPYRRRPPRGPLLRLDIERVVHWRAAPDE